MEFEFLFDVDDWMAFNKHELKNSKQFKRRIYLSIGMMPLMFCVFLYVDFLKDRFNWIVAMFYFIIAVLWAVFYPKRIFNRALKNARKNMDTKNNDSILGWHTYHFEDDYFLFKKDNSETKVNWAGIVKFVEIDDYFFLFDSNVSGYIISKAKIKNSLPEFKILFDQKAKSVLNS